MQEKVKTPKQPVKGFVTVELFDNGYKIKTVKSKNMITQFAKAHMIWDMKEDFFRGCPGTLPGEPGYYLNNIILTSSTATPQDIPLQETGSVTGWADKTPYSGSDVYRGTINTAESYATNDKVHWVFDWPTHAGNGTFQTIIWGNKGIYDINQIDASYIQYPAFDSSAYDLTIINKEYWITYYDYNGKIRRYDSNFALLASYDSPASFPTGITHGNNCLWVSCGDNKIYKMDISNMSVISSYSSPATDPKGLTWYNNKLYVVCGDNKIYGLNPETGAVVHSFTSPMENTIDIAFDNDGNIWTVNDYATINRYNLNNGNLLNSLRGPDYWLKGVFLMENNKLIFMRARDGYNAYIIEVKNLHIGARTLLPQPVTKTNQQTMKVQYDFLFEE